MTDLPADRDLLNRFLAARDEAAFAELVRRHAPGVWGACRRRLDHLQDAEDAFQAAFVVLVRRAGRLRPGTPLGPWLGKVAALTARNVLRGNRRRAAVSGPLEHDIAAATVAEPAVDVDAALRELPDADRAAVTLCHLDGLSRKEAAERLGCPEGTLSARLSRAIGKLRARLADEVPPGLVRATVRVAVVAGVAGGSAGASPAVAQLAEEAIRMLWVKKLTAAGLVLAAAGMVGLGVARTADAGGQDKAAQPAAKAAKSPNDKVAELEQQLDDAERTLIGAQMRMVLIQERLRDAREKAGAAKPAGGTPAANAEKPRADPDARVRELEAELKQTRAENFRLRAQAGEVPRFLGEVVSPPAAKLDPPPAQPKLDPPAKDPAADLQRQFDQAEAEVKAAQGRMSEALQRREFLYGRLTLARQAAALRAGRDLVIPGLSQDLKLVVLGDANAARADRYQLTETQGGKPVVYLTPSPEGLAKLLTRAKADPNGPKTVLVQAEAECQPEPIRAALAALRAAGFKSVAYDGPHEGDLHGAAKGPGAWKYDRAKRYTGPIDLADVPKDTSKKE